MALLEKGGFRLTKWTSNSREVLASIPEDKRAQPTVNLDLDDLPIERALGVLWNIEKDTFQFEVFKPDKPGTKRGTCQLSVPFTVLWVSFVQLCWEQRRSCSGCGNYS